MTHHEIISSVRIDDNRTIRSGNNGNTILLSVYDVRRERMELSTWDDGIDAILLSV